MSNSDDVHFDEYREQTKTKHRILVGYLQPYFDILKGTHKNLLYIDGFAGRGSYTDGAAQADGSPLLALKLLSSKPDLQAKVQCFFVEQDQGYFEALSKSVEAQQKAAPMAKKPVLFNGDYNDFAKSLRKHLDHDGSTLAPTFLFIDPCGVDGVHLSDISHVLASEYCEVFIFFNFEGVNRIAGAAQKSGGSATLEKLFGEATRVASLTAALEKRTTADGREEEIMSAFQEALRQASGAQYFLRFRVESEGSRKTSHYFIHATKHPLGFKIMKDVMWSVAAVSGGDGGLQLLQASKDEQGLFLRADLADQERAVLAELAGGKRQVGLFTALWVQRPTDLYSERSYRKCLLRLEETRQVVVLGKDGVTPTPAKERPIRKGEATLAKEYWVTLA